MDGGNKKYSVLVVEDDPQNLKFLKLLLSRDFNVLTCSSESEFYRILVHQQFDAVLMDITLSGNKSGISLIKSLRQIPLYKNTPVICLSAHIAESDELEALNAGANLYLRKPVQNKILIDSILEEIAKSKIEIR
ncbi:MAG: response regulator [Ignavibacterium sp.]